MKKILIWGTGAVCSELLENGLNGEITGFIESSCKEQKEYNGIPVYGIDNLPPEYDRIVIANTYTGEIYDICTEKGLDLNKIIFLYPVKKKAGCTDKDEIREILGEANYTGYCARNGIRENTFFERDKRAYEALNTRKSFAIEERSLWPIITDKYAKAGTIHNYFRQDLWAARLIHKSGVRQHFDIGSRIDGFIAHLLAMEIEVTLIDIREFPGEVEHLNTIVDDATLLNRIEDGSIESMSALCSLEHFGLGRYGDPIDPEACFLCFTQIRKKLKPGGNLYVSVPVGRERVEFNAHRVFAASTIVEAFGELKLGEYSCTADGQMEYHVDIHKYDDDPHNGEYRYGLFHFIKE